MASPTLIIGLGSTGMEVLERIQKFHYEFTGKNSPKNVRYIYLETDIANKPVSTPKGNDIKQIAIGLQDKEIMVNKLKADTSVDNFWVPDSTWLKAVNEGAGGLPAFGRLALWGAGNFDNALNEIQRVYREIGNNDPVNVYMVGSLTGGTGSGVLVDLAYMVRNCTGTDKVYGLFLLPPKSGFGGKEVIYYNSYTALKALDYYNNADNTYDVKWPNGINVKYEQPPYEVVQLITQDYDGNKPTMGHLRNLVKIAGLYLFMSILDNDKTPTSPISPPNIDHFTTFREVRMKRLIDAKANHHIKNHTSFGLSLYQYPKAQIEEYLAIDLCKDILEQWVDHTYIVDNNNKKINITSIVNSVEIFTKRNLELLLKDAFNTIDGSPSSSSQTIHIELLKQSNKIIKNEIKPKTNAEFIEELFSSSQKGKLYEDVKNNLDAALDRIIIGVDKFIEDKIEVYQNLHLAKQILEFYQLSIENLILFWASEYHVKEDAKEWNKVVSDFIDTNFSSINNYSIIFEKENILEERLGYLLKLLKMHLIIPKLQDVVRYIGSRTDELQAINTNVTLPSIPLLDNKISIIRDTISSQSSKWTLETRKTDIESDIEDTSVQIYRIYKHQNFQQEVHIAHNNYNRRFQKVNKAIISEGEKIWRFILNETKDQKAFYNYSLNKLIEHVKQTEVVENYEIANLIVNPENIPALVKIKQTVFTETMYMKKLIASSDKNVINQAIIDGNTETFELKGLLNSLLIYQEYGYLGSISGTPIEFDPLKNLSYMDDLLKQYDMARKKSDDHKKFHILRNPYVEFKD